MDRNSNSYTFIFSIVMVIVVGSALAYAATSLAPLQSKNVKQEKMQNILATVGIETDRTGAQAKYEKYIEKEIVLNNKGEIVENREAFNVDLAKELDKPVDEQVFPLYVANVEGKKYYIVPVRGSGLWDEIWGYISLESDLNTVAGATFDHAGETPGLGAEITKDWFGGMYVNEKIFDTEGNLVGIFSVKGYAQPNNNDDHKVDTISGATITSDGVTAMISERFAHYVPYFKKQENFNVGN
ncbi:MAG TPA: NADH:ubiquinone reductase (Na(+)-transporting) subunit C [Flavobacteriaceae bacterium]|nr:NADH:ubiquinone reductase (Na(+)-transporting) subunit C [Flavobacteriaceae bacterium]